MSKERKSVRTPKPPWFRVPLPGGEDYARVARILKKLSLTTVCEGARCPNQGECWGSGTATLMILGDTCTRRCRFCGVKKGNPGGTLDRDEPKRVADAIGQLGLKYAVITSVDRDDLPDGGAAIFASTVAEIRKVSPGTRVELLTPDFGGDVECLGRVARSGAQVLAHNVETVRRLTPVVRDPRSDYDLSMEVLRQYERLGREHGATVKTSLMLGMGETDHEVEETLRDFRRAGVSVLTLGQYLSPGRDHYPVDRYVDPAEFTQWREVALGMGFAAVASGPLVRSSYQAHLLAAGEDGA